MKTQTDEPRDYHDEINELRQRCYEASIARTASRSTLGAGICQHCGTTDGMQRFTPDAFELHPLEAHERAYTLGSEPGFLFMACEFCNASAVIPPYFKEV